MAKQKWDKWDIEEAARTLIRAQRIQSDQRPGFYAAVKVELKKQTEAAERAALEAKVAAKLHNVFNKGK